MIFLWATAAVRVTAIINFPGNRVGGSNLFDERFTKKQIRIIIKQNRFQLDGFPCNQIQFLSRILSVKLLRLQAQLKMIRETAFLLKVADHKIGQTVNELWLFYCWLWRRFEWWNIFLFYAVAWLVVAQERIRFCFPSNHIAMIKTKTGLSVHSFFCSLKDEGKDLSIICPHKFFILHPLRDFFQLKLHFVQ